MPEHVNVNLIELMPVGQNLRRAFGGPRRRLTLRFSAPARFRFIARG
jgi:hypothetical protein